MSESDVQRFLKGTLIGDLAIGDSAYTHRSNFCVKNEKLHLIKNQPIKQRETHRPNIRFKIIPKNKVIVTIHTGSSYEDWKEIDLQLPWLITPTIRSCERMQTAFIEEMKVFEVESIEGFTDMLSYIDHLKSLGFKYEP
nr:hypothetical protein 4 [Paracoccaceae bacterium]